MMDPYETSLNLRLNPSKKNMSQRKLTVGEVTDVCALGKTSIDTYACLSS